MKNKKESKRLDKIKKHYDFLLNRIKNKSNKIILKYLNKNIKNIQNKKTVYIQKFKLNLENIQSKYVSQRKNLNAKGGIKFIGIYFSENNLFISNILKINNKLEIKKTVQVEIPGDVIGEYKVENIKGLSKIIENIISIYKLDNVPVLLLLGSPFFKSDTFSKDSILIVEDKYKIISSKSPYIENDTQFLINEVEGDKYSNYTRVLYCNKSTIESWIKSIKNINNPLIALTNGLLPVVECLNKKNDNVLLAEISNFITTIYYIKKNCELITFSLPYGSDIYSSENKEVRYQYFERLDKSLKEVFNKINNKKIEDIYITGSGLSKVLMSGEVLPFNLKLLDSLYIEKYSYDNTSNNYEYIFNQYSQILLEDDNYIYNFFDQYENLNIWNPGSENKKNIIDSDYIKSLKNIYKTIRKERILYYPAFTIIIITILTWLFASISIFNVIRLKDTHRKYLDKTNQLRMVVQSLNLDINKVIDHSKFYTSSLEGFLFGKLLEKSIPNGIQVTKIEVNKNIFNLNLNGRNLEVINEFILLIRNNPMINSSSLKIDTINSIENPQIINSSTIDNNKSFIKLSGRIKNLSLKSRIETSEKFSNKGKVYKFRIFSNIKNTFIK
tara:strand:+ start:1198 stop:3036 length:1839 start_codon:yes stop_codon:yes gene_type:complete